MRRIIDLLRRVGAGLGQPCPHIVLTAAWPFAIRSGG